jgi:predicted enzyme related to lactoylglutathione lyase
MPNQICHFEIGCRDIARSKDFYSKVFDWRFEKGSSGDEVIRTGADVGGHLHTRTEPRNYVVFYVMVDDVSAAIAKAQANGGKVVLASTPEGQHGAYAWIADPEGNVIGIYEQKR